MLDEESGRNREGAKGMSTDIASAGIGAAGGLLGGLFDAAAKKKAQGRELAAKQAESAVTNEIGGAQAMNQGQSKAFGSLMDAWKSALLK